MMNIEAKSIALKGLLAPILILVLALPVHASVNKSVKIPAGTQSDGASSVNGSITIESAAIVTGDVSTVNGAIRVDEDAHIHDAETVNGSLRLGNRVRVRNLGTVNGGIRVGDGVTVDGEISAVNGQITVGNGTNVAEDVSNVNGQIKVRGAEVEGDLSTVSGDVELAAGAVLKGDLIVDKPTGWGSRKQRKPKVIIGPGSRVEGSIRLKQEVELYISDTAEVGDVMGEMSIDDAVRFSGESP